MICPKCGKANRADANNCMYCGAEMLKKSGGNRFSDILSFQTKPEAETRTSAPAPAVPPADRSGEERLIRQVEKLKKELRKTAALLAALAFLTACGIFISVLALRFSHENQTAGQAALEQAAQQAEASALRAEQANENAAKSALEAKNDSVQAAQKTQDAQTAADKASEAAVSAKKAQTGAEAAQAAAEQAGTDAAPAEKSAAAEPAAQPGQENLPDKQ